MGAPAAGAATTGDASAAAGDGATGEPEIVIGSGGNFTFTTAHLVSFVIFSTAGGPFGLDPAVKAGGPLPTLIAFLVLPLIWCLPIALTTAELATAIPENGGVVVYALKIFGPFWAAQAGWWTLACNVFNQVSFVLIALDTLARLVDYPEYLRYVISAVIVLFIGAINATGKDVVGSLGLFLLAFILAPFLVFSLAGIHTGDWARLGEASAAFSSSSASQVSSAFASVLANALWNYQGFSVAGQVRQQYFKLNRECSSLLICSFSFFPRETNLYVDIPILFCLLQ